MAQVFDRALLDFYHNTAPAPLFLHNNYGFTEEMPVEVFFREPAEFPEIERLALSLCVGEILDVGAGVGTHTRYLQQQNKIVYAIERSKAACEIMTDLGTRNVIHADFFQFSAGQQLFDTLLFMMNGIGLAQNLENIVSLLEKCQTLLKPGGQILFDSSDISYLFEEESLSKPKGYYGEVVFQYEYKGEKGEPFGWVYVDQNTMHSLAVASGWEMQVLFTNEEDQYLARLVQAKY